MQIAACMSSRLFLKWQETGVYCWCATKHLPSTSKARKEQLMLSLILKKKMFFVFFGWIYIKHCYYYHDYYFYMDLNAWVLHSFWFGLISNGFPREQFKYQNTFIDLLLLLITSIFSAKLFGRSPSLVCIRSHPVLCVSQCVWHQSGRGV